MTSIKRIRSFGIFSSRPLMIGWIATLVVAEMARRSVPSIWIDAVVASLLIGLWASIGVYAVWELRRWGSLSFPINATWLATIGLCLLAIAPFAFRVVTATAIGVGLLVTFVIVLMACWFAPRRVVALTGGPRVEWQLLQERYRIAAEAAEADNDPTLERPGFDRVQALDRFRTPRTTDYIDTYQRLAFAGPDGPIPAPEFQALEMQFDDEERELFKVLRARPAWEDELVMRVRNADPATADSAAAGSSD